MPRAGRRYSLLIYTHMLDRWWPATLLLGVGLLGLAWAVWMYYPEPSGAWRWLTLASIGGFVLLVTIFLFGIRKAAYVQPFPDHMRLVTPFLRLNISYKRVQRTTSATIGSLFPPKSISSWRREILEPLASRTAVVVELNGFPISQTVLRLFLSPFFFKDKSPHFVILVNDWMRFSSELETMRAGGDSEPTRRVDKSILSRLPHK
ncbi:MAG TPA: hypothetical protein VMT73_05395 [Anaerolineales bacterium]|nr:hypothetical protein [Anaerolineales bacterium]